MTKPVYQSDRFKAKNYKKKTSTILPSGGDNLKTRIKHATLTKQVRVTSTARRAAQRQDMYKHSTDSVNEIKVLTGASLDPSPELALPLLLALTGI